MKIVEREHYIPASTTVVTIYVASDGKEFYSEIDCIKYEKRLEIQNHPVYATAIKDVVSFKDEYDATLYYFSNEEDYKFFFETYAKNYYLTSDFTLYGAGWYICWIESGGDYRDDMFLYNYNIYEKEIEESWQEYKTSMRAKIDT